MEGGLRVHEKATFLQYASFLSATDSNVPVSFIYRSLLYTIHLKQSIQRSHILLIFNVKLRRVLRSYEKLFTFLPFLQDADDEILPITP